jgi:hypothetical protein
MEEGWRRDVEGQREKGEGKMAAGGEDGWLRYITVTIHLY